MTFALHRRDEGRTTRSARISRTPCWCAREQKSGERKIRWVEADALHLPFAPGQFQLVTSAFGFRNLANYDRGWRRFIACWRPEARSAFWISASPRGLIGKLYRFYFHRVLPAIGTMISGVSGPYAYLAGIGAALSCSRGDAATHARRGIPRGLVDAVYVWDCGAVSGEEVGVRGRGRG